jgi:hypothetical protein
MKQPVKSDRRIARAALVLAAMAIPLPALAATGIYNGPDGGSWNTPANWLDGTVPVNGDGVFIFPTGPGKTVVFNGNYASPGLTALNIDETGFGTAGISQSTNNMVVSGQEQIGYTGRGRYTQTGGTNTANTLFLGGIAGATGTYQLDFGTLTTTSELDVGSAGSGTMTQTGGTVNVSGFGLNLGARSGGNGSYYLNNGNLNANVINNGVSGGYGNIQQTGGAITITGGAAFNNGPQGTYNLMGGNLSAPFLNNSGNIAIAGGFFSGGGINNSYFSLVSGNFTNSAGFTNYGILTLSGGMLVNNALTTNVGQLQINGNSAIVSGGQFINDTQLIQNSGSLTFTSTGTGQFINNGNMQLAAGWSINFGGSNNWINNGTINLNGGRIAGIAFLINQPGATITGAGVITSLSNQGRLLLTSGTTRILVPLINGGIIELDDPAANLAGGAITNTGEIGGHGSVGNDIANSGTIEASGGTLILGGDVNNTSRGTMSAPTGGKLFISTGLGGNAGVINLSGGTFDNNNSALSNTGQISGFGTLRTGGLSNDGTITFTGGFTTINGDVTNLKNRQLRVAYNPALFTGTVTNGGTFKNTATTITFAGEYHENGTYISDPADNYFNNVNIAPTGAWVGGKGDRFFVSGDFRNQSTNSIQWDTAAAELHLLAGSGDILAINGRDLGISFDGYANNFAWGTLSLAAGRSLTLIDADSTPGGAVYVDYLDLQGGLAQIAAITGNGLSVYYDLGNPDNAYLDGKSYSLAGGGSIAPVPEPVGILMGIIAAPLLARRKRTIWRRV